MASLALLAALSAWACSGGDADEDDLTVFVAASLRPVFRELDAAWQRGHPGSDLTVAADGSNVLAAQIAEGAPADVFVSADPEQPQRLSDDGHATGTPVPLVRNRVTLVAPAGSDAVSTPADLARPGIRLVAVGAGVPISAYADRVLARLATTMPDPDGFAAAVAANVVSREDNVRAALTKVELGEGDAAFVYATDALGSDGVREVPLPGGTDVSAEYAAIQVSDRAVAHEFLEWLGMPEAAALFRAAGFEVEG